MALLAHQKLNWVLPGKPFGRYRDGDYASATAPTMTALGVTGTAGQNTITVSSTNFQNGDVLKLVQSRGTNAGQWELVKVLSGGGTVNLTLTKVLQYTYADSGANQAQAIKVLEYRDVTVQAGTWSVADWDGNVGGELVFACRSLTPTGTISASGKGFRGGNGLVSASDNVSAYQGEGTGGAGVNTYGPAQAANGNGAGAANRTSGGANGSSAGGGGNAAAGTAGTGGAAAAGAGGLQVGDVNLQSMPMGGAGGGALVIGGSGTAGAGGDGGGNITIYVKTMSAPTSIISAGLVGGTSTTTSDKIDGSGGGAGGNILIVGGEVNIGTDKLSVIAGSFGAMSTSGEKTNGGAGAKGRIAVYYGKSVAGSVASSLYGSLTSAQDVTLKEVGGFLIMFK